MRDRFNKVPTSSSPCLVIAAVCAVVVLLLLLHLAQMNDFFVSALGSLRWRSQLDDQYRTLQAELFRASGMLHGRARGHEDEPTACAAGRDGAGAAAVTASERTMREALEAQSRVKNKYARCLGCLSVC